MLQTTFSRKGGQARSAKKTAANRAKASSYWKAVREGIVPAPRRYRKPPTESELVEKLAPYCRRKGITRLEIFGSAARGTAGKHSDVDLIATFQKNPGLNFFSMEDEMTKILRVSVHLLSRESVEEMTNPFRRESILADARAIYHARA